MFQNYKINTWIQTTLKNLKISKMTPIQQKTFKDLTNHKNVIGVAPTGSGKTLAFLVPLLNQIDLNNKNLQLLIISPTRELARQINEVLNNFKKVNKNLTSFLFISGQDYQSQIEKLKSKQYQIIISTVNRINDALDLNIIPIKHLKSLVLDEADMMLDLGFMKDIEHIIKTIDNGTLQKSGWSATLHEMLAIKLSKIFKNTKIINVTTDIYQNKKINHFIVYSKNKYDTLDFLIANSKIYLGLIFANTKKEVDEIYKHLLAKKYSVIKLHGNLQSRERKNNYKNIKKLNYQYVVASDLASRGLDIEGASHVISWNIPAEIEWYIHRAGRAGRLKYTGDSYIIYDQNNKSNDKAILNLINKKIKFKYLKVVNDKLVEVTQKTTKKVFLEQATNAKIQKIINKKQKVKPNYKKKQKVQIQKIKQKSKRKHIDDQINKIRIKKYKLENSKNKKENC